MKGATLLDRLRLRLRERLVHHVTIRDGPQTYSFRCESEGDAWRARTLLEKEPGTVQWIRDEARPGDVFYDIGANIGLYTIIAGRRVFPGGWVYAFEPHLANARTLLHNVRDNGLSDFVRVLSVALNDREGYYDFHYQSAVSASSQSQLHAARDDQDRPFTPIFSEVKHASSIDRLIQDDVVRPPDLVKIDVDGNEPLILRGMQGALSAARRPRALQIEIGPRQQAEIIALMQDLNYELVAHALTALGEQLLAAGASLESIPHNALFKPRSTPAAAVADEEKRA